MDQYSRCNRRDFSRLSAVALGGVLAGASLGAAADDKKGKDADNPLLHEPHVCRGLNTCKNLGGCGATKGKNACAGAGACATAVKHECRTHNECKGQGGCGENPGENACKGQGKCAVPLSDQAWAKARKRFEALMKQQGKTVAPAPPKA